MLIVRLHRVIALMTNLNRWAFLATDAPTYLHPNDGCADFFPIHVTYWNRSIFQNVLIFIVDTRKTGWILFNNSTNFHFCIANLMRLKQDRMRIYTLWSAFGSYVRCGTLQILIVPCLQNLLDTLKGGSVRFEAKCQFK